MAWWHDHYPVPEGYRVVPCENRSFGFSVQQTERSRRGYRKQQPKLSPYEIQSVRMSYEQGQRMGSLSERLGVSKKTIWKTVHQRSPYDIPFSPYAAERSGQYSIVMPLSPVVEQRHCYRKRSTGDRSVNQMRLF